MGDLGVVQRQPLAHKGRDERFSGDIFDQKSVFAESFDFAEVLMEYHKRNGTGGLLGPRFAILIIRTSFFTVTVKLDNEYSLWRRGSSSGLPFTADITINYPEQTLSYKPGFWQVCVLKGHKNLSSSLFLDPFR